ncbi:aminotransferase DegT [Lysinibacillus sp. B2A1]|nr:aminotransferase DegT [Lysinibacillus sp. B2A1]
MNKQWVHFAENVKGMYGKNFVPLHEPTFDEKEVEYVTDCVKTGWVSSVGAYVSRFEEDIAKFVGVKRGVAVVNGTAALHIALKVAGVEENDEVLMPALTFIATANAVTYLRAIPHFVDVELDTLGIDPGKLRQYLTNIGKIKDGEFYNKQTNRRIKALVPMHTFGHAVRLEELQQVCEDFKLLLIEDSAESLGTYYKGKHTGSFGKVSALSFNGNKIITTGGGGIILTDHDALADYARHLTTTAKVLHKWEYEHDEIGFNYRMPNINAALGCAQLEKMHEFLEQKRELTIKYEALVENVPGVRLFKAPTHSTSNYWLQTLILDETLNLNEVLTFLNENGVMSRPIWKPMHLLQMYKDCPKMDLTITNYLNQCIVNIPSTPLKEV